MGIKELGDHLGCFNYDHSQKPIIETVRLKEKEVIDSLAGNNKLIFMMKGSLKFTFQDSFTFQEQEGQMFFLPAGMSYSCQALQEGVYIVFRVHSAINICAALSIEKLYKIAREKGALSAEEQSDKTPLSLDIHPRIQHFLEGIHACIADGLKCQCWLELKIKEFFTYLRVYYTKESIFYFLHPIISGDAAFSELVRKYWQESHSVNEMAELMHMTSKQFSARFVAIFGKTPYRWMMENRAVLIHREITATQKPFKQIAAEHGFATDAMFTRFCKKELGSAPSQIRENEVKEK